MIFLIFFFFFFLTKYSERSLRFLSNWFELCDGFRVVNGSCGNKAARLFFESQALQGVIRSQGNRCSCGGLYLLEDREERLSFALHFLSRNSIRTATKDEVSFFLLSVSWCKSFISDIRCYCHKLRPCLKYQAETLGVKNCTCELFGLGGSGMNSFGIRNIGEEAFSWTTESSAAHKLIRFLFKTS